MRIAKMNNPRRPLLDEIARAAEQGFDALDLTAEPPGAALEQTDWRAVAAAIADAGLDVVLHASPFLPVTNPSPLVRQAALDELRRTVDAAQIVGAPFVTTHFAHWPAWMADADGYESYRQLYTILCRHGEERGIAITMENSPDNHHQLKHFREICARVPQLRMTLDIAHTNVNTVRPLTRDYCFALADRLAHVHLCDNDGTSDGHLPLGAPMRGGLDVLHELRALRSFRYDAIITLEIFGDERWLLASRDLLRDLWEQAA
jgi:sugar phosphate isomerase/epimerase